MIICDHDRIPIALGRLGFSLATGVFFGVVAWVGTDTPSMALVGVAFGAVVGVVGAILWWAVAV